MPECNIQAVQSTVKPEKGTPLQTGGRKPGGCFLAFFHLFLPDGVRVKFINQNFY